MQTAWMRNGINGVGIPDLIIAQNAIKKRDPSVRKAQTLLAHDPSQEGVGSSVFLTMVANCAVMSIMKSKHGRTLKNTLSFKGFTARIEFDPDDNVFFGRVLGVQDIIGFHGETVAELTSDFHDAINHYLEVCRQRGEKPQRVYSGKLTLRVSSDTHADIAAAAAISGKSLNKWVADTLRRPPAATARGQKSEVKSQLDNFVANPAPRTARGIDSLL